MPRETYDGVLEPRSIIVVQSQGTSRVAVVESLAQPESLDRMRQECRQEDSWDGVKRQVSVQREAGRVKTQSSSGRHDEGVSGFVKIEK